MQLQADMGKVMAALAEAIYLKSGLEIRVREAMRMRIAQINQCQACLNFRFPELEAAGINKDFYAAVSDWKNTQALDEKEKLAIDFSERFINDHLNINDDFFAQLKQHFSDTEIYEMSATIAGLLANRRILQVLQIDQSCAIN